MAIKTKQCGCGCGEMFTGNHSRKYAEGHAPSKADCGRMKLPRNLDDYVDADVFNLLIKRIKNEQNLTWEDVAWKTGRKMGTISSFGRSGKKWVSKDLADDMLKRLAGTAKVPTPRQEKEYTALRRKDQSEQRSETLKGQKLEDRKAAVADLKRKLGSL